MSDESVIAETTRTGPELRLDLPPALATPPGAGAVCDEAGARKIGRGAAEGFFTAGPVLVAHASLTARRLGLTPPPRSSDLMDVLELYAFVRPARFCAPSPTGLALALGRAEPKSPEEQATALRDAAAALLGELAAPAYPEREAAYVLALTMQRAGWAWGERVVQALEAGGVRIRQHRGSGLDVWTRLTEWEDEAPRGEAGSAPVDSESARIRLEKLLQASGLDETRPTQSDYAAEAAFAFSPRNEEGRPRVLLAEAGTGTGKTLGYLAPASLWAERNQGAAWISTYTRALQRQIDRESHSLWPDPAERRKKAVIRKGRENYLCVLNLQDMVQAAQLGNGDLIGLALAGRWAVHTRDGDMTGGDFPGWLPGLFALPAAHAAGAANLVDRRGECVHAACPHYRTCFVEKTIRASRKADIVVANHALVLTQAAFDGARSARGQKQDGETAALKRIVFDEGHHLFDAADSAFSACLSGQEAAELRRWIRGPEGKGRRGRGLEQRLGDMVNDNETALKSLQDAVRAAASLPGEGVSGRVAPASGEVNPIGPIEAFLAAALNQLRARTAETNPYGGAEFGMECALKPVTEPVAEAARAAAQALAAIEAPLLALSRHLEDILDDEAAELDGSQRSRIEGALRGLDRRARMTLPGWRSMLAALEDGGDQPDPDFVDWLSAETAFGRIHDVALRRHWIDPTVPLEAAVIVPSHGVLVTSATLSDPLQDDPFDLARMRTGSARLIDPPRTLKVESPFDYAANSRVIVVNDLVKDDPRQTAAAMRELFLAAGGGGLGLFTAIRRLKAVYERLGPDLAKSGLPLYAQHVDPLEVGALVDMFRVEENSCLLGTDAVRDGVDVPGRSLRVLAFDRVPWPRPDLLHKARRERLGGKGYDDAIARARIGQAFGRLIRRGDDKGVFLMLDAATPTRLFASLPPGTEVQRMGLADAVELTKTFLNPETT
ncbi:ATP-dependent DNA helicase [Brevundimonas nasdae]|uniref:ATP-dependent DNA helicase n=2 Tax=Pseudomonadota TaxID=1224 RepID=A0ABX8TGJ1_9CAUL|nr:ATP-dependent DNA helicase [Brevundimonas nasdae]QYC09550.1 ATP-dependent DNA helicase [Brevundimonas nasdae]QYC15599.1 ATP-dependent DNA helicase [Brevundimonas nasdae]